MLTTFARCALAGALSLALSTAAHAQPDDQDEPAEAGAPDEADPDEPGEDPEADQPVAEPTGPAPAKKDPYPQRALNRPRTLPGGAYQAKVELSVNGDFDVVNAKPQVLYSPVDKFQVAATYDVGIEPFELANTLVLAARYYSYKAAPHLFNAVQITIPLDFTENDMGERTLLKRINLAPPTKYKFNDSFGLFFGDNLIDFFLEPEFQVVLNLPIVAGFQANDNLFMTARTDLLTYNLNEGAAAHFGDRIPLALSALWAFDYTMDVVAALNLGDVSNFDSAKMKLSVTFQYRGGFGN